MLKYSLCPPGLGSSIVPNTQYILKKWLLTVWMNGDFRVWSLFFFFFFCLCYLAYRILVPQPGIDSGATAVKALAPNPGLQGENLESYLGWLALLYFGVTDCILINSSSQLFYDRSSSTSSYIACSLYLYLCLHLIQAIFPHLEGYIHLPTCLYFSSWSLVVYFP